LLGEHGVNRGASLLLAPANGFAPDDADEAGLVLGMLMAVTGLVLLIACANVANLLLARGRTRSHEYGIRIAVGASRGRLVRQHLVESLILSLGAAATGALIAQWSAGLLVTLFETIYDASFSVVIAPDVRIVGFSIVAATGSVVVFGLAPAFRAARLDAALLIAGGSTAPGRRGYWRANTMVIGQVALSVVVLVVAVLFVRSLQAVRAIDPGMHTAGLLVVTPQSLDGEASETEAPSNSWKALLTERVGGIPGVEALAWTDFVPLSGPFGRRTASPIFGDAESSRQVAETTIGPGFFNTAGITLLAGRDFTPADNAAGAPVVIVNEALAARFWPEDKPVGQSLFIGDTAFEVIGVAATSKYATLAEGPVPFFFRPLERFPARRPSLLVRTSGDATLLAEQIRSALGELPGTIVARDLATMDEVVAASFGRHIVFAQVVGLFGLIALMLAVAGAYGATSYMVSRRTAEIGVRMALGAHPNGVLLSVVRGTMGLAVIGVTIGSLLAAVATPALASLIPGVEPTGASTFLIAASCLLFSVALAGLVPARRASRVDPLTALRRE